MIDRETEHKLLGTSGPDLLELAKQWADNKIHVHQFVNEAEKIVAAVAQKAAEAADKRAADIVRDKAMKMDLEAQYAEA